MKGVSKRHSRQRDIILSILRNTPDHLTAQEIYTEAKKDVPDISLGTIYRNLKSLVEEDSIRQIVTSRHITRYDGHLEPHAHFICQECGKVFDVNFDVSYEEIFTDLKKIGMVSYARMNFVGLCLDCMQKKEEKICQV